MAGSGRRTGGLWLTVAHAFELTVMSIYLAACSQLLSPPPLPPPNTHARAYARTHLLQSCRHPNLVELKRVVTGSRLDSVFLARGGGM